MLNKHLFPTIVASGTPREIGLAHGKGAKKEIGVGINTYKAMFWDYSRIKWEDACRYAGTFVDTINEYDADYMEEIQGIAEGSGYEPAEILALNVRSEIVLQGGQISGANLDGCTSFVLTPCMMENGSTVVGQNWDWKMTQKAGCIVMHIRQQKKPDITMVTEAGIIGKIGFNSAGIGVALNALSSDERVEGKVLPLHIALRGILDSATLSDAIGATTKMNLSCCAHYMLGSAKGEGISLEVGPGVFDALYAEEGWLAHTNHFITPRLMNVKDTSRVILPDSFQRLGRARTTIRSLGRKAAFSDLKALLADHTSYPDSICRHEDELEPAEKRLGTIFGILMDLGREEMYFAPGNPCNTEFRLLRFS
ncbi:MAG: C45 family peptidase [Candidatus Accumulibacter sp.]|jgi:isopenicillin-N N-acyltransferase-like protein|nr:C45 family peptidase [Accumulibacter sp.]